MFGLISACAFADATPKVEAKMPTLATIRACFIVYLPWTNGCESKKQRPQEVNVPNFRGKILINKAYVILSCFAPILYRLRASRLAAGGRRSFRVSGSHANTGTSTE